MQQPDSQRDDIELIATEFIENFRDGVAPPIEGYIERYPHLANEINELFPMIAALETMKKQDDLATARSATSRPMHLSELGDFKIVKEIGRGGMGVVYQAFQESLDRHVALKVLPKASLLDAELLKRFRQEARMAARLHHSNIVSLYGMGEHDGYHFLVMELVDGESLDTVIGWLKRKDSDVQTQIQDRPGENQSKLSEPHPWERDRLQRVGSSLQSPSKKLDWHAVARLARDAAASLQYAFDQGVLHRDIKPANLLLDVDGRVWISDFGLAQPLAAELHSTGQHSGGTPRYFPPEAVDGERDHSSDVYSLGLTIYELLTLTPAFTESTPEETVARVEGSRRPVAPAVVDSSIPEDIEAIVLKSIENDTAARYETAGHLAADLDRFIEGFPVEARPVGAITHGVKWCQRNPLTASLLGVVGSLLLMMALISSAGYVNALAAKEEVSNSFQREKHARKSLESTLQVATGALDDIYQQLSPDPLQDSFATESLDAESSSNGMRQTVLSGESVVVLENLLGFYDTLASRSGNSLEIRRSSARAKQRLGDVHFQLGQVNQARLRFENALESWKKISKALPKDVLARLAIARVLNKLGRLEELTDHHQSAQLYHGLAVETLESIEDDDADVVYERASALYFLGRPPKLKASVVAVAQLSNGGRRSRGRAGLRGGGKPPRPKPRADRENQSGGYVGDQGFLESAVGLLEQFPQYKDLARFQFLKACCYRDLEEVTGDSVSFGLNKSDHVPDLRYDEMATVLLTGLVDKFPENANYRYELVETLRRAHGRPFEGFGVGQTDRSGLSFALKNIDLLVRQHPNQPRYLESRMHVLHRMGHSLGNRVRDRRLTMMEREMSLALAINLLENASRDANYLIEGWPDVAHWRIWAVVVEASVAEALLLADDQTEALECLTESVSAFEQVCEIDTCRQKYVHEIPVIQDVLIELAREVDSPELEDRLKSAAPQ